MLLLVRYTALRTKKGLVHQDKKVVGQVPGDPKDQVSVIAKAFFPYIFNPDGTGLLKGQCL